MHSKILSYYIFLALLPLASCFHEEAIPAAVSFSYEVVNEDYSIPVELTFENKTTGAEHYLWTFEGGDPETSDRYNPGPVRFAAAGTYTVRLEAWNGDDRQSKEITIRVLGNFSPDFETSVATNSISPVQVTLTNTTIGGTAYRWEFPDGVPASFTGHDPPVIEYTTPGQHTITLVVENGNEIDSIARTITVLPGLAMEFAIEPSFQDEDYEAPLTASLVNSTIGGLIWKWTSTGGDIQQATAEQTSIHFTQPGTYTITLTADNGKVTQSINREIVVKPNTGLRTHHDVMLGINTAHGTIGSFYSTFLRRVVHKDDPDSLGQYVDIAFFGLNANFTFNRFVSPDSVQQYTFEALEQAQTTHFINTLETCGCGISFTEADFDQMETDAPLRNLNITSRATGLKPFTDVQVPRIVLFRTSDDRKGAIKIKAFHRDGQQSYVVVDIKIQKP